MKFCSVAMRKLKQPMRNYIASTGVSYIRDDLYAGSWEPSTGVYVQPSRDMGWLTATKANGLKVVGILGPNWHYQDNYDPVAMSNLAAWIAKTGLVSAFRNHERTEQCLRILRRIDVANEACGPHECGYGCCSRC
jgi:hypothetical protein